MSSHWLVTSLNHYCSATGAAENPSAWIDFMKLVEEELPLLSGSGRPTKSEIEHSVIGQSGYTSWREMLESGVGMNWSNWVAWRRAWAVIKEYPYLADLELTASQINTMKHTLKDEFPPTVEAFNSLKNTESEQKKAARQASFAALRDEIQQQKALIQKQNEELSISRAELLTLAELRREVAAAHQTIGALNRDLEQSSSKNQKIVNQLEVVTTERDRSKSRLHTLNNRSFLQKLKALF